MKLPLLLQLLNVSGYIHNAKGEYLLISSICEHTKSGHHYNILEGSIYKAANSNIFKNTLKTVLVTHNICFKSFLLN